MQHRGALCCLELSLCEARLACGHRKSLLDLAVTSDHLGSGNTLVDINRIHFSKPAVLRIFCIQVIQAGLFFKGLVKPRAVTLMSRYVACSCNLNRHLQGTSESTV